MNINERDNMNVKELEKAYLATPEYQRVMVSKEIAQFFITEARLMEEHELRANQMANATPEYKALMKALRLDEKQKREAEAIQDVWDKEEFAKDQEKIAATENAQKERRDKAAEIAHTTAWDKANSIRDDEVDKANAKCTAALREARWIWEASFGEAKNEQLQG